MGNKNQKSENVGCTPDQINEINIKNKQLEDQVTQLNSENDTLKQQLNTYLQNMQGNYNKLQTTAFMNINQAMQNIMMLKNQIGILNQQNAILRQQNYKLNQNVAMLNNQKNSLDCEITKYKFYCNKMQLMLLNKMQELSMKENINSWQRMNTPMNNSNSNMNSNINMNNNNKQNFNYRMTNSMTIIFNVNNTMKCPISVFPDHKLGNVFVLALYQNGYSDFVNIKKFSFRYNTFDISNFFYQNKEVRNLNLGGSALANIEVTGF